jgi:hypothetical protein
VKHQVLALTCLCLGPALCRAQVCSPFWASPERPPVQSFVIRQLLVYDDGSGNALYAGGVFWVQHQPVWVFGHSVWRFRGETWEPVGEGLIGSATNLLLLDTGAGRQLFTEGVSSQSGSTIRWFKRWDGVNWGDAPPGMWSSETTPPYDNRRPLFSGDDGTGAAVYGYRMIADTTLRRYAARWDGTQWTNLGGVFSSDVSHFLIFDPGSGPRLHVAGSFTTIGGNPINTIARWSGAAWESVGLSQTFRPSVVRNMCVFDDGSGTSLYVAFERDQQPASLFNECIARWNGTEWSSVGGGLWAPPNSFGIQAWSLEPFDDGSGPALYVSGTFSHAGGENGIPVNNLAKWDGQQWSAVGPGGGINFNDMQPFNDPRGPSLFVGGGYTSPIGGGISPALAQWVGCPNCYANCDNSTTASTLNIADFSCFLQKFAKSDPYANCNVDATIDIADFACFLQKFAAGCP